MKNLSLCPYLGLPITTGQEDISTFRFAPGSLLPQRNILLIVLALALHVPLQVFGDFVAASLCCPL
jgi:hypothetical protein